MDVGKIPLSDEKVRELEEHRPPKLPVTHRSTALIVLCIFVQVIITLTYQHVRPLDVWTTSADPDFSHLASHCAHIAPIASDAFLERQRSLARTLHALNASAYIAEPGMDAAFYANLTGESWRLTERPLLLIVTPEVDENHEVQAKLAILTPSFEASRAQLLAIPSASKIKYSAWPEDADPFLVATSALPSLAHSTIFIDEYARNFIATGLQQAVPQSKVETAPVEIKRLRERKSAQEIEILKCVNEVTVLAIRAVREKMYIGMRESEASRMILDALASAGLKDRGALVLFGENAALPHGTGTDRVLGKHDFALIDTDGSLHGYNSDVTRTFALRDSAIHAAHLRLWNLVHTAQARALSTAHNGTITAEVDRAAREVIASQGYGKYFTHRLGHGIGLDVHESPYLRGGSKDVILTGNAFSDEPGIYIEEQVGVRLEDCFYISEDGDAIFLTAGVGGAANSPWDP